MRPLVHPSIDDVTVEGILHALADPVRVAIFARIDGASDAQTCTDCRQIGERTLPKSTLSQHFTALRDAGLIRSVRHGVENRNTSRAGEIERRFPGLLAAIVGAHARQASLTAAVRRPRGGVYRSVTAKSAPKRPRDSRRSGPV